MSMSSTPMRPISGSRGAGAPTRSRSKAWSRPARPWSSPPSPAGSSCGASGRRKPSICPAPAWCPLRNCGGCAGSTWTAPASWTSRRSNRPHPQLGAISSSLPSKVPMRPVVDAGVRGEWRSRPGRKYPDSRCQRDGAAQSARAARWRSEKLSGVARGPEPIDFGEPRRSSHVSLEVPKRILNALASGCAPQRISLPAVAASGCCYRGKHEILPCGR